MLEMNRTGIILLIVGAALLLWAASVGMVYWDATRQRMSSTRRTLWLALATFLPGAGFFAYLLVRMLNEFLKPAEAGSRLKWFTNAKRPQGPAGKGSTIPATDLLQAPNIPPPVAGHPAAAPGYPGAPQAGLLWLTILEGPEQGRAYPLQSLPAVIGRGQDVAIPLDGDMGVSRHHAEIYAQGAGVHIRDLRSTHGTYVNGHSVNDKVLAPGDKIAIGQSILQVQQR